MKSIQVVLKTIAEAVLGFCACCAVLPMMVIACLIYFLDEVWKVVTARKPWKTSLARDWVLGKRADHVAHSRHW